MNNIIMAIDQATVKTGIAIFKNDILQKYYVIDVHKEKDSDKRFKLMCLYLCKEIQDHMPQIVVFEDVSLQTNVSTLQLLSQLQGVIIGYCLLHNIPYIIYKPSHWRKALKFKQGKGIKRKELKEQSIQFAKDKFNIDCNDDMSDAICLGLAYIENEEVKGV